MALSGNGFFTVSQGGATQYTRAGAFQTDNNSFVVNATGQNRRSMHPTPTVEQYHVVG